MRNRGGIISARAGYEERKALRAQAAALGLDNLSDFIRIKLGLPRGVGATAPLPEMNDLDDYTAIVRNQVELINRIDNLDRIINRIAKHLAVPTEKLESLFPRGELTINNTEPAAAATNGGFER